MKISKKPSQFIESIYPLSPMQQGMFFHHTSCEDPSMYFVQMVYRFKADLQADLLRRAWELVVARHPVLRSLFVSKGSKPVQIVRRTVDLPWCEMNWCGRSAPDQETSLRQFLDSDRKRGFDLTKPCLIRLTVIRMGQSDFVFVWSFHHIILDGWCKLMVLKEAFIYYQALAAGNPPPVLPEPLPYRNYIAWLSRQSLTKAEDFWREVLSDLPAPIPLEELQGFEAPGDEHYIAAGKRQGFLSEDLSQNLREMAARHHVTLNTIVQGAWSMLLARYSQTDDVVFGIAVSGRPPELPGVETSIGMFINTQPMRVHLPASTKLSEWLRQLQAQAIAQQRYEYTPLFEIQKWLKIDPRHPLFETLVVFENFPVEPISKQENREIDISNSFSFEKNSMPISILITPDRRINLELLYDPIRISPTFIQKAFEDFQALLEKLPNSAECPLEELTGTLQHAKSQVRLPQGDPEAQTAATVATAPSNPVEQTLMAIWQTFLPGEFGIHQNFFSLGGHSIVATAMLFKVNKKFGVQVPWKTFFEYPTIAHLAQVIQGSPAKADKSKLDLASEIHLPNQIRAASKPIRDGAFRPQKVLLTGATGFLGAFLLDELLQKTEADIYCLVRAASLDQAQKRLHTNLAKYDLQRQQDNPRILPLVGDLEKPRLGLDASSWHTLADELDFIIHNGALVNFTRSYAECKAANVNGTLELLELSCSGKQLIPVHFLSSSGVVAHGNHPIAENDPLNSHDGLANGYAQSKWVAEHLAMIARKRGLPVSTYRVGRVAGHSQTGAGSEADLLFRLIRGCIELGAVPKVEMAFEMSPVDQISAAIVGAALQRDWSARVFHLINPNTLSFRELFEIILGMGYPLTLMELETWRQKLEQVVRDQTNHPLQPLYFYLFGHSTENRQAAAEPNWQQVETMAALAEIQAPFQPLSRQLVQRYLNFFQRCGLLKRPFPGDANSGNS